MGKVKQLLNIKGSRVWTISKDSTVYQALEMMAEKNIGALVVMDGDRLTGIFSERDHALRVGLKDARPAEVLVADVMTQEVITVSPDTSVNECLQLMTDRHVRHLPVLENGELVGIISIGDAVKDTIEELRFLVEQLEGYITGLR